MGAYFVLYPHSRVLTLIPLIIFWEIIELPAIFLLGFWFLMQLFSAGAIAVTARLARRRRRVHGARRRLRGGRDRRLRVQEARTPQSRWWSVRHSFPGGRSATWARPAFVTVIVE